MRGRASRPRVPAPDTRRYRHHDHHLNPHHYEGTTRRGRTTSRARMASPPSPSTPTTTRPPMARLPSATLARPRTSSRGRLQPIIPGPRLRARSTSASTKTRTRSRYTTKCFRGASRADSTLYLYLPTPPTLSLARTPPSSAHSAPPLTSHLAPPRSNLPRSETHHLPNPCPTQLLTS